jgi:hypothetical protein
MDELDEELLADVTKPQQSELHRLLSKLSQGETLIRALDEIRGR